MKYWRVEREECITQVVHVRAESKEEAILLAEGKYERRNSWLSGPWVEEMTEAEWKEESE